LHVKGYLAALDTEFATYIKQKKNDYEEVQNLQEDDLMTMAENKYKSLVSTGEWNAASKEQKEILAFTAKLESIIKKKKSDKNKKPKKVLMEGSGPRKRKRYQRKER